MFLPLGLPANFSTITFGEKLRQILRRFQLSIILLPGHFFTARVAKPRTQRFALSLRSLAESRFFRLIDYDMDTIGHFSSHTHE